MSITGSGTEQDPYLVHSYDELKTVTTENSYCPQYGHRYISLDADINCNDYGDSFEWETISLGSNNRGYTLDLNGHTIKNAGVKKDNSLLDASYKGSNVYGEWHADFIGNGKLLNIFTASNSTGHLIKGRGTVNVINNLSISANLGADSRGIFRDTSIDQVACYVEGGIFTNGSDVNALLLSFSSAGDDGTTDYARIKNCDFDIHVNNLKVPLYTAYNLRQQLAALDSRFRGKISTDNTNMTFIQSGYMSNCVWDVDLTDFYSANSGISRYNSTGVINADNMPGGISLSSMTSCTSSEIRNGDALRGKGFTVVNVVAGG